MFEVLACAIDMIGNQRAAGAPFLPCRPEHEMADDELIPPDKQVREGDQALGTVEDIILADQHPRQRATLLGKPAPLACPSLLLTEQRFAGLHPLASRYDAVRLHSLL